MEAVQLMGVVAVKYVVAIIAIQGIAAFSSVQKLPVLH
jgi:hypothetical protein